MENNSNYKEIIARYLNDAGSKEDEKTIRNWIENHPEIREYYLKAKKVWDTAQTKDSSLDSRIDAAWNNLANRINKEAKPLFTVHRNKTQPVRKISYLLKYAAIGLLLIGLSITAFYLYKNTQDTSQLTALEEIPDNLESGYIVLADGTKIPISSNDAGIQYTSGGKRVVLNNDSILFEDKQTNSKNSKGAYNQVVSAKGQFFSLTLADGTKVWLNSETVLKYPVYFTEKQRIVYLSGEAYFDVTHNDTKPFIVKTPQLDIEVLGTKFNVSSYKEDGFIETTLESGSVSIKSNRQDTKLDKQILKPSYKAKFNTRKGKMKVQKVDTELYTSWKDGYLKFKDASFKDVIRRLSHNYGVSIIITDKELNKNLFSGKLERKTKLDSVLGGIQLMIPFEFATKNNKLMITKMVNGEL